MDGILRNRFSFLVVTVVISATALPVSSILNTALDYLQLSPTGISNFYFISSAVVLPLLFGIGLKFTAFINNGKSDWMVAGMFVFCFTCVIDFTLWLELIGAVQGYMALYAKHAEPYLDSSWGAAMSLLDLILCFPVYLWIINCRLGKDPNWHILSLYWCGGFLNTILVHMVSVLSSKHQITLALLSNVPYVIMPFAVLNKIVKKMWASDTTDKINIHNKGSSSVGNKGIGGLDLLLTIGLAVSMYIHSAKGLCALGGDNAIFQWIVKPELFLYLEDPAAFGKVQGIFLFAFVLPIQCLCIKYTATGTSHPYSREVALFYAGLMFSCQFNYIYAALDWQSHPGFITDLDDIQFWIVNLLIVIVPHLLLVREEMFIKNVKKIKKH